jgi:hypothetical protein
MHSITLTTSGTKYNLFTLMQAIVPNLSQFAQSVQIQLDNGAGAANLYIGDPSTVASTDCGVHLVASQAFDKAAFTSDMLQLNDFGLTSDTNSVQVNVTIITR